MTRPGAIIIAEIGENHIGDMALARDMIRAAATAGADIVKFQSYRGEDVAEGDPEKEWFTKVALSDESHADLKALAEETGVGFLSSPFSLERTTFLCEKLGLKKIKIASSEMTNTSILSYLNKRVDTVFLSTGMATLDEIRESLAHLADVPNMFLLHCTTQYPLSADEANLRAIPLLRETFPHCQVGYSDHTIGLLAPVVAVALGATVIEKHFTLDKTLPGTDHILSVTPGELAEMVRQIRETERLLGQAVKGPTAGEQKIVDFVRNRFPKVPV